MHFIVNHLIEALMKKFLVLIVFCMACSSNAVAPTEVVSYEVTIAPSSSFQYVSPKHYSLTLVKSYSQTLEGLDAVTTAPDGTKFNWESSIKWDYRYINDTLSIPTINCCSYSYKSNVRTMFSPVYQLKGDSTMVIISSNVKAKYPIADTIIVMFK